MDMKDLKLKIRKFNIEMEILKWNVFKISNEKFENFKCNV